MAEKGIILEIEGRQAIVLTAGGDFRRVPLPSAAGTVGDEIDLPSLWNRSVVSLWQRRVWWLAPVAAVLIVVLLLPLWPWSKVNAATYYVSIDINPSLELTLNGRERVIEARGLNQEGQNLLTRLNFRGQPVAVVLRNLLQLAVEEEYLKSDGAVVIAVTPAGKTLDQRAVQAAQRLQEEGRQALAEKARQVPLQALTTTRTLRQEAQTLNLSSGRYAVLLEAQSQGLSILPQDLKKERLSTVITRVGGDVRKILQETQREKAMEALAQKFREKNLGPKSKDDDKSNKEEAIEKRKEEGEAGKTQVTPASGLGSDRGKITPAGERGRPGQPGIRREKEDLRLSPGSDGSDNKGRAGARTGESGIPGVPKSTLVPGPEKERENGQEAEKRPGQGPGSRQPGFSSGGEKNPLVPKPPEQPRSGAEEDGEDEEKSGGG